MIIFKLFYIAPALAIRHMSVIVAKMTVIVLRKSPPLYQNRFGAYLMEFERVGRVTSSWIKISIQVGIFLRNQGQLSLKQEQTKANQIV